MTIKRKKSLMFQFGTSSICPHRTLNYTTILQMTPNEFAAGEAILEALRQEGFFEVFIEEVQQWSIERSKSTGRSYVECLREVIQEEKAQMQCAIMYDEEHIEFIDKPLVN